jgi:hypothetical protein
MIDFLVTRIINSCVFDINAHQPTLLVAEEKAGNEKISKHRNDPQKMRRDPAVRRTLFWMLLLF